MLQSKSIYPNKTSFSFSDLIVGKMLLLWLNSPSDFDGQLSEVLVTSCLCPTFPVYGGGFVAAAGLLSLKGASH